MGLIAFARRTPSAVLLTVQLAGLLIYPLMLDNIAGQLAFECFSLVVLTLAVFSVRATPGLTWVSITLGLPALITSVIAVFAPSAALIAGSSALHAMFYFYAAYSLIRYMLADRTVTRDELYATGATFTLVAWGFAYVFLMVEMLDPGSFTITGASDEPRTWLELLYLSFTTLTSTGLSEIYPLSSWSRSVVMFEQLAGVGFLAMVVSRMVSLSVIRLAGKPATAGPTTTSPAVATDQPSAPEVVPAGPGGDQPDGGQTPGVGARS